jgi:hypothetical protein
LKSKKNKTEKWTPAKNDPDRMEDWYHVGDLITRSYIDHGPVPVGALGEKMLVKQINVLYKSMFGDDAPSIVDGRWNRFRWVSLLPKYLIYS